MKETEMNGLRGPKSPEINNSKTDDAPPKVAILEADGSAPSRPKTPRSDGVGAPAKKRKTRRGKSKRKAPYQKYGGRKGLKPRIVKPAAPHNDNQFLFEDHGGYEELDERLKKIDQASSSSLTRTRDSSFPDMRTSYPSPVDENEFRMQDFNDQYQSIQTEQLQTMSKQDLLDEYLALDNRMAQKIRELEENIQRLERKLDIVAAEKDALLKDNEMLKAKLANSDSADSETDSSDSCSSNSSSSRSSFDERKPLTNGHLSPPNTSVDAQ